MKAKKYKVLITGGRGLLGSHCVALFKDGGWDVEVFEGDIAHSAHAERYEEKKFDCLVHAAACTSIEVCERDRKLAFRVNVEGTRMMRDLAKKCKARFIYISTASVFSGDTGNYTERDHPYPRNYYSLTKYLGEVVSGEYSRSTVVRLNVVGVHPHVRREKNFLEWLTRSLTYNKDITLYSDVYINALTPPTLAKFLARIISLKRTTKLIHIGSRNVLSKADIGLYVAKRFPMYHGRINVASLQQQDTSTPRGERIWLNTKTASRLLGPMPTLKRDLASYLSALSKDL